MIVEEEAYLKYVAQDSVSKVLEHIGVKGMRWGVRKDRAPGVSREVDRHARKDAHEFARSKAFFGEGAGTRRKLIKQTVEGKTKNIPGYKQAFDHHLSRQDTSQHASKAVSERTRIDRKTRAKQRAGFLARHFTGEMGTQAAFAATAVAGAAFLRSGKGRALMTKTSAKFRDVVTDHKRRKGAAYLSDYFKKHG